jgi:hypothetical protein
MPENTLKYGVGLMLVSFGTFWAVEGLGVLRAGGASLEWPGGDAAILALLGGWFLLSRALVAHCRRPAAWLPPLLAMCIGVAFTITLLIDTRPRRPRPTGAPRSQRDGQLAQQ